ncbi:MAG: hypothetical protein QGG53_26740 [Planctomycetota bacterium]|nr:hypothetical protein [Planctomycetota bacterium]
MIDQLKQVCTDPSPRYRIARRAAFLVALFALSVVVRARYINRPLSAHYEWVTAPVLITQQIWYEEGAFHHHFLPVLTYPGVANRNISNDARMKNEDGVWYYTSYPPLSWIAPYVVFRMLGVYPDVLPLQIFNLFLHLICAVFIYLIVYQLLKGKSFAACEIPAFIASAVYIFAPFGLWFHCNTYSAQWLNHPWFAIAVYVFIRILDGENDEEKKRWVIAMGGLTFLMFYTAWFGVLFYGVVGLYALIYRKEQAMRWLIAAIIGGVVLAALVVLIQMSAISGPIELVKYFLSRFSFISGYFEETDKSLHIYDIVAWRRLLGHYYKGYGGLLFFLAVIAFVALALGNTSSAPSPRWGTNFFTVGLSLVLGSLKEKFVKMDKRCRAVAGITILPVCGHHVVLFNYSTVHEYSVLTMLVAISTFTGVGLSSIISRLEETRGRKELIGNIGSILTVFLILIAAAIGEFREQNKNGHTIYKTLGEMISKTAKSDEVVFVNSRGMFLTGGGGIIPHIVFYAHRNLAVWKDMKTAQDLIKANGVQRGIVFSLVREKKQYRLQHHYIERQDALSKAK